MRKRNRASTAFISVKNLEVGYAQKAFLPPISFSIEENQYWGIIGSNGGGKSTLLKTLLKLTPSIRGSVYYNPAIQISYIPQKLHHTFEFSERVIDLISGGLEEGWSFLKPNMKSQQDRIAPLLEELDLEQIQKHPFNELSEGQKQRVLIARALVRNPQLLVLDEPTSAMDVRAKRQTLGLLGSLQHKYSLSIVIISHHLSEILKQATHLAWVDRENSWVQVGPTEEVVRSPEFIREYGEV